MEELYNSYAEAWELVRPAMERQNITRNQFIVRCWMKDADLRMNTLENPENAPLLQALLELAQNGEQALLAELAEYLRP